MRSIGFRANPSRVTFAIAEGEPGSYALVEAASVPVPPALWRPNQLHFIRTVLLDVMEEYHITRAGLRLAESVARHRPVFRDNLEGLVQELLASSGVEWYFAGQIARITKLLGVDRTLFKKYVSGEEVPPFAGNWKLHASEEREAILTAAAAINGAPAEHQDVLVEESNS